MLRKRHHLQEVPIPALDFYLVACFRKIVVVILYLIHTLILTLRLILYFLS